MHIILFDGICNLCHSTVSFVIKRDRKALFRFASMQSETAQLLLKLYNLPDNRTTLYYFRNSICFYGSTAILYILKDLGKGWKLLYLFVFIPVRLRDGIYFFISRHRYRWFGKRTSCNNTSDIDNSRFLR